MSRNWVGCVVAISIHAYMCLRKNALYAKRYTSVKQGGDEATVFANTYEMSISQDARKSCRILYRIPTRERVNCGLLPSFVGIGYLYLVLYT